MAARTKVGLISDHGGAHFRGGDASVIFFIIAVLATILTLVIQTVFVFRRRHDIVAGELA